MLLAMKTVMSLLHFNPSIATVKQSCTVSQMVNIVQSFSRSLFFLSPWPVTVDYKINGRYYDRFLEQLY